RAVSLHARGTDPARRLARRCREPGSRRHPARPDHDPGATARGDRAGLLRRPDPGRDRRAARPPARDREEPYAAGPARAAAGARRARGLGWWQWLTSWAAR